MKVIVTDQTGQEHELEGLEGWQVMEIIRDHGLPIKAECGGACCCATCHVYVDEAWLPKLIEPSLDEQDLLEDRAEQIQDNSRLSCQILMKDELDGLRVTLAPGSQPD